MYTTRTASPNYDVGEDERNRDGDNVDGALPDRDAVAQSTWLDHPDWRKGVPAEAIQAQSERGRDIPEELGTPRSPPREWKLRRPKTYEHNDQPGLENGGEQR